MNKSKGFTLIEIAIVLVIIGLLLGGLLKGQELITGARVRNLISQQDGIKTAFFGFQDRFRALPGDYAAADTNINCGAAVCPNGDGNGRIEGPNGAGTQEGILAWTHLSAAGFLNGSYTTVAKPATLFTLTSSPVNPYGVYLELLWDNNYGNAAVPTPPKHNLKTGNQIPVDILAEIDRKVDDGFPYSGAFQLTTWGPQKDNPADTKQTDATCVTGAGAGTWNVTGGSTNCGAASLF